MRFALLLAATSLALVGSFGCSAPRGAAPPAPTPPRFGAPFVSPLQQDNPRVGQILLDGREIASESVLLDRAMAADIVYLGEKHDNADHHRLQAHVIDALVRRGARPSIVLEMVDEDEQAKLDSLSGEPASAAREILQWEQRGWPDFALYAPIFRIALQHRLPLLAGNAPKAVVKRIAFAGHAADAQGIEPELLARFGLDVPLDAPAQHALEQELAESHCGMLPATALAPMALAQRARDFTLAAHARRAKASAKGPRSVVIAGAGHVRADRGAPYYARRAEPQLRQLTLAFAEVSNAAAGPNTPFDAIWLTPVANAEDHCKDFARPK